MNNLKRMMCLGFAVFCLYIGMAVSIAAADSQSQPVIEGKELKEKLEEKAEAAEKLKEKKEAAEKAKRERIAEAERKATRTLRVLRRHRELSGAIQVPLGS